MGRVIRRVINTLMVMAMMKASTMPLIIQVNALPLQARWTFDTQEPEDLTLYADALPKLAAVGMRIPVAWAQEKLRIPEPEGDEAVLGEVKPAAVTAPVTAAPPEAPPVTEPLAARLPPGPPDVDPTPVTAQTALLADASSTALRWMVEAIRQHVETADSLESLRDTLVNSYGDLPSDDLTQIMALAFACADLSGRYDVSENG